MHMEPLQDQTTQMIMQLEEEKGNMVKAQEECTTLIQEKIIVKEVEMLMEKFVQVQTRGRELAEKFHSIAEVVKGVCST
jgi:hypothetical protein